MITTSRRAAAGAALILWAGGLVTLASRQRQPPQIGGVLTESATKFNPGPAWYLVERNGKQVGFASSTADTEPAGIVFTDYLVLASLTDSTHRVAVSAATHVTRGFVLKHLEIGTDTGAGWNRVTADLTGDSTITLRTLAPRVTEQSARADASALAPDVVPMVLGMAAHPKVGTQVTYRVVDAAGARVVPVTFQIAAESLFVVSDSATFDSIAHHWRSASADTVRAWKIIPASHVLAATPSLVAWVDGQGRIVDADAELAGGGALTFHRTCYELAYRNWPGRHFR